MFLFYFKEFFRKNPVPQAHLAVEQAIEIATSNVYFLVMQENEIAKFLHDFASTKKS
jgi:hypothetical protein